MMTPNLQNGHSLWCGLLDLYDLQERVIYRTWMVYAGSCVYAAPWFTQLKITTLVPP